MSHLKNSIPTSTTTLFYVSANERLCSPTRVNLVVFGFIME